METLLSSGSARLDSAQGLKIKCRGFLGTRVCSAGAPAPQGRPAAGRAARQRSLTGTPRSWSAHAVSACPGDCSPCRLRLPSSFATQAVQTVATQCNTGNRTSYKAVKQIAQQRWMRCGVRTAIGRARRHRAAGRHIAVGVAAAVYLHLQRPLPAIACGCLKSTRMSGHEDAQG